MTCPRHDCPRRDSSHAAQIPALQAAHAGAQPARLTGALPLLAFGQFTPGYLSLEEYERRIFLLTPNIPEREAAPRIPVAPQAHAVVISLKGNNSILAGIAIIRRT